MSDKPSIHSAFCQLPDSLRAHPGVKALMHQARELEAKVPHWQPIETAPKDSSYILVADMTAFEPTADRAHWGVVCGKWTWRCGGRQEWADDPRGSREYLGSYDTATHWMPIPAAPATTKE